MEVAGCRHVNIPQMVCKVASGGKGLFLLEVCMEWRNEPFFVSLSGEMLPIHFTEAYSQSLQCIHHGVIECLSTPCEYHLWHYLIRYPVYIYSALIRVIHPIGRHSCFVNTLRELLDCHEYDSSWVGV